MGQNSSMRNRIALQLEHAIGKLESHRVALKEVTLLKKETFQNLITELNKAVAGITDSKGCRLQFNVVAGTMDGRYWKSSVRVDCWKIDAMTTSVSSHCRFSLRQFQKLYDELMFLAAKATCTADSHTLKYVEAPQQESSSGFNVPGTRGGETADDDVEAGPADELCSLCEELSTDLTLSCGHCYCQGCLDKWLHIVEKNSAGNQASSSKSSVQGGDCPLCKPSKQYESLLKGRPLNGGAKLRVRVSPEMADELTALPERIRAEFVAKRKQKSTHRSGAQKLASKLTALRQPQNDKKKGNSVGVTGIQRLTPARSETDLRHASFGSDDDDYDDDVDYEHGVDSPTAANVARSLAAATVSSGPAGNNPAKKEGAFAKAKQLFRFGRSNTTETGDTDNLLSTSSGHVPSHTYNRK